MGNTWRKTFLADNGINVDRYSKRMKITVIGGGNIGTLMAAEMLRKGHEVTVCSSRPEAWGDKIQVLDEMGQELFSAAVFRVSDSLEEALKGAELVFVTTPAQTFATFAQRMDPYMTADMKVGIIPGSGGAEYAFSGMLRKGCVLFGVQRVHSIARLKEYGKSVIMLGRKKELQIGAVPACEAHSLAACLESLFDMPCAVLSNYLCVTLTPSNPILHTTRLYSLFRDYRPGVAYPENYLFYENWDDASSEMLIACDSELQALCSTIPLDLKAVRPLQEHYESHTARDITEKIRSIAAFRGLRAPMVRTVQGWMPDFTSRYFTADFPYGLKVIMEIAQLFEVPVPCMKRVWQWYERTGAAEAQNAFRLNLSREDFLALYR